MEMQPVASKEPDRAPGWRRWLPLAALLGLMALAFAMGWHKYLSLKTIGLNYEALKAFVTAHTFWALAAYMLLYVGVVALSLPGGLVMTLAGGLLFGWKLATPATVVAATIGATAVFLAARTSFGETLAAKAGDSIAALREGFKADALNYLLFLRLVPAFPFVVVNLAPALLGVPLKTYVIATFLGIIPGTAAFSVAGSGLGSVVEAQNKSYHTCLESAPATGGADCPYTIDTSALVTNELLAAFALLGAVALIPVILKRWRRSHV